MNNVIDNEVIKLEKKTRQINEKQEKAKKIYYEFMDVKRRMEMF